MSLILIVGCSCCARVTLFIQLIRSWQLSHAYGPRRVRNCTEGEGQSSAMNHNILEFIRMTTALTGCDAEASFQRYGEPPPEQSE